MAAIVEADYHDEPDDLLPSVSCRDLDASLRCPICSELLKTPLRAPCGHAFCSACMRRYTSGILNPLCPVCKGPAGELRVDALLGTVVDNFSRARPELLRLLHAVAAPPPPPAVARPRGRALRSAGPAAEPLPLPADEAGAESDSDFVMTEKPKAKGRKGGQTPDPPGQVRCPSCQGLYSLAHVEAHTNACLDRRAAPPKPRAPAKPAKAPPPKLVVHLLSGKQLIEHLVQWGLFRGDEKPKKVAESVMRSRWLRFAELCKTAQDVADAGGAAPSFSKAARDVLRGEEAVGRAAAGGGMRWAADQAPAARGAQDTFAALTAGLLSGAKARTRGAFDAVAADAADAVAPAPTAADAAVAAAAAGAEVEAPHDDAAAAFQGTLVSPPGVSPPRKKPRP